VPHVPSLSAHLIKSGPSAISTQPMHMHGVVISAEGLCMIDREMIVDVFPILSNSALTTDWRLACNQTYRKNSSFHDKVSVLSTASVACTSI